MEEIKIDKNVPLLRKGKTGVVSYPWEKMEVGDSFFIEPSEGIKIVSLQGQLISNATSYCKTHGLTWKFKTRREDKGVRIWRVL